MIKKNLLNNEIFTLDNILLPQECAEYIKVLGRAKTRILARVLSQSLAKILVAGDYSGAWLWLELVRRRKLKVRALVTS